MLFSILGVRHKVSGLTWIAALLAAVPAALAGLSTAAVGAASARHVADQVPSFCHRGGQKLWNNLVECGWPGPGNTGADRSECHNRQLVPVGNGTSLIVLSTPNEVVSCQDLRGPVSIRATNVTIVNSLVTAGHGRGASRSAAITVGNGASATISHVTINGGKTAHACIWHQGISMIVNAVDCYGSNDGIFAWATGGEPLADGSNYSISNSYFHGFTKETSKGHDDGFQTEGSSYGLIDHNTFQMALDSTSAVAIWDSRATASDITVSNNLMSGGGFSAYAEDYSPGDGAPAGASPVGGFSVTNIQFDNNSFSTLLSGCVGKYGVWFTRPTWVRYQGGPTDGWHRLGNVVVETGQNIDQGNPSVNGQVCR
jgi:hypothetical protein